MTEAGASALLGPADIRRLAEELGVRPTKKLGQNFVHDPNTVRRIVSTAALDPDDVVLEVGPGLGSLTLALLPAVRHVVAVEIDPVLAERLPATVAERAPDLAHKLTVLNVDALRVTADQLAVPAPGDLPTGATPLARRHGKFPQSGFPTSASPEDRFPDDRFPQYESPQDEFPNRGFPEHGFPQGEFPQDRLPKGGFPQERLPVAGVPEDQLPPSGFPEERLPEGGIPEEQPTGGKFPDGSFPKGAFPGGKFPQGAFPEGGLPSDEVPGGRLPSGEFPEGRLPLGQFPAERPPGGHLPGGHRHDSADEGRAGARGPTERLRPTALVANLPYNVSVPVVLHLLAELPTMTTALVMVQAEVADRIAAGPGAKVYGVPSVKVAWYAEARRVATVPRSVFWPVPNVDSALVLLTRRPTPDADRQAVFTLVDAAFAQRRKTLRAALAAWAGSADRAAEVLTRAGVDPSARGETLTVGDFAAITRMAGKELA